MDDGTGTGSDSESILPDFPPIDEPATQIYEDHSKMRPGPSGIENMDDSALDVDIKEEVGELFMGRSIDEENDKTVFPSGLILIQHQTTMTVTASNSRLETHLLLCTPVYNDPKTTPSFLQVSTPNRSTIRTRNSEVEFVQQRIQPRSSASAQFCSRLYPSRNLLPQDPLKITGHDKTPSIPDVKFIPLSSNISWSKLEGVEGERPEVRNCGHNKRVKQCHCAKRQEKNETPEQRNKRLAAMVKWRRQRLANETPDQTAKRLAVDAERQRQRGTNETLEQKTCEECGITLSSSAALQRHMGIHNKRYKCEEPGCRKSYASLPRLKAHMVIHSGRHIECCKVWLL